MLGPRSRLSLMVLFVPACLLVASATVRVSLMQPWTMWQPPVLEPWLPGAQPPPPEQVGHALFGGRLYGPATVLARATLARNAAMATLAVAAVAMFLLHRFSVLMVRPPPTGDR